MSRIVLHVDMDAFYAAVEQRDHPELRGQPVIVGGTGTRGVALTASYEARKFGVHSAMPIAEARRRCPHGFYVAPRMSVYKEISAQVFEILRRFTPLVQGLSLDEAFLDVTASQTTFGSPQTIAREIKQSIRMRTGLTASVGAAPNKLIAKIASDLRKPDGLVIVAVDEVTQTLDPLPIAKLFGVGPKTQAKLLAQGIRTFHDLRLASDAQLQPIFGRDAPLIRQRASGIDHRPVLSEWDEKQISTETTFDVDIDNANLLRAELLQLSDRTASRLRKRQLSARGIALKIRRHDFHTFTRQRLCQPPTNDSRVIAELALQLLATWLAEHPGAAVRLLGVGAYELGPIAQLSLFDDSKDARNSSFMSRSQGTHLDAAIDGIRGKFGADSLIRASGLQTRAIDRDF